MAQVIDFNIAANPSGLNMRTELNGIIEAILTQNSGTDEPLNPFSGMEWVDKSDVNFYYIKKRNLTNDDWEVIYVYDVLNNKINPFGEIAYTIETVNDFVNIPTIYKTAIVKDLDRGGTFIWSATGTANGGTVFAGATGYWNRQYSGAVNVKWFGAVGDGVTDDTVAIQSAFNHIKIKKGTLHFPPYTYIITQTIGTDSSNNSDYCDDVTIIGYGAILKVSNLIDRVDAIRLEGNNCHVRGLTITSTKTIDHTLDPATYRGNIITGIRIGGKYISELPATGTEANLRANVSVIDCILHNLNSPIHIVRASNGQIENNTVEHYSDTGITVLDCVNNINITNNTVRYGSDDNIACINYATGFYVNGTTNEVGNINITNNELGFSFGKFLAVAGYSDINFSDNICNYSWAAGIGYENGDGSVWSSRSIDNRRLLVDNNIIRNSGAYFGATYWRTAAFPSVKETSAISGQYNAHRTPYPWKEIAFTNNTVFGALTYGVALVNAQDILVEGNRFVNTVATGAAAVYVENTDTVTVTGNTIKGGGFNFKHCYHLYNNMGALTLSGIEIHRNTEAYITGVLNKTASEESAINYISHRLSGYNGIVTSYGSDLSIERYAFKSQGGGSNFNLFHRAGYSPYIFNTSGTGLNVCTDSTGAAAGNFGVSVPVNAPEKLTVNGNISPYTDNVNTCGTAARRWSVVYAGTGTINTSDDRTKTYYTIEEAETLVARELKSLIKKFKFNDAIEVKGESGARIHYGTSAQSVISIFEKHGLNAMDYAMVCYDEWDAEYEQIVVKNAEFDEEGNIIEPAIYENGDIILPAGNRYGIRYEELLCFIIGAM